HPRGARPHRPLRRGHHSTHPQPLPRHPPRSRSRSNPHRRPPAGQPRAHAAPLASGPRPGGRTMSTRTLPILAILAQALDLAHAVFVDAPFGRDDGLLVAVLCSSLAATARLLRRYCDAIAIADLDAGTPFCAHERTNSPRGRSPRGEPFTSQLRRP